jgi:hypothetical protein
LFAENKKGITLNHQSIFIHTNHEIIIDKRRYQVTSGSKTNVAISKLFTVSQAETLIEAQN